jgi:hypothetical protein
MPFIFSLNHKTKAFSRVADFWKLKTKESKGKVNDPFSENCPKLRASLNDKRLQFT